MADKKTYRERSGNTVGLDEIDDPFMTGKTLEQARKDKERLMKTRPGFFNNTEPHTKESIMRGLEEAEIAEKGTVGRALNRLKTNVMGSAVDNELAAEQEAERARKNPEGNEAKFRKIMGKKAGGAVGYKAGGKVSSASKRADGCAIRGKTRA